MSYCTDKRHEARKRQKQRQRDAERGAGSADVNEMAEDDQLLADPEEEKPKPPPSFDEEQALENVSITFFLQWGSSS